MEEIGDANNWLKLMAQIYQWSHTLRIMQVQDIFTLLLSNIASEAMYTSFCSQTMLTMILIDLVRQTIQENTQKFG